MGVNSARQNGAASILHTKEVKRSLNVIIATVFIASISFSVVMPSMNLYLDGFGANVEYYGLVVSIYSVGQFFGSLALGYMGNKIPVIIPLILGSLINGGGNVMYSLAPSKEWVLYSRLIVGFGAGIVSCCRAFASNATDSTSRNSVMALISAAQGLGFILGPAIGGALHFVHFSIGRIICDDLTLPGYASAIIVLLNILFLLLWFRDIPSSDDQVPLLRQQEEPTRPSKITPGLQHTPGTPVDLREMVPRDNVAMGISIFIFMTVIFVFSVFEAMGVVLTHDLYGWGTLKNGSLFAGVGLISVATFASVKALSNKYTDHSLMMTGMAILTGAMLVFVNFDDNGISLFQFIGASALMCVGYPLCQALSYTIYSKVLGSGPQGLAMGILTAAGSTSRVVGPYLSAYIYNNYGPSGRYVFVLAAIVCAVCLAIIAFAKSRLVPHPSFEKVAYATVDVDGEDAADSEAGTW